MILSLKMSLCMFTDNETEIIKSFLQEGFIEAVEKEALVGKIINLRYVCKNEDFTEIGGVFLITEYKENILYAKNASYRGGSSGAEEQIPDRFWWKELSEDQKTAYIKPSVMRVRNQPTSVCPEYSGENYIISDPEKSFLARDQLKDTQVYFIHDNGGVPFKVIAYKNAIEIYCDEDLIWDEEPIYNQLIVRYTDFMGLWPGYDSADYSEFQDPSPKEEVYIDDVVCTDDVCENKKVCTEEVYTDDVCENKKVCTDDVQKDAEESVLMYHCSRSVYGQTQREDHNSILIKITDVEYVYVGSEIYSFKTKTPIINYYSPLGNNDVPYPVAYGENEVYFMCDYEYVTFQQMKTPCTARGSADMYNEYYGNIDGPEKVPMKMLDKTTIHKRV
jgi:hypothetical protein